MKIDFLDYSANTEEIKAKGKFINRELSWLDFNKRVLLCTQSKIPMNEKLNFLSITTSNLNEFISVRYSEYLSKNNKINKTILQKIKSFMSLQNDLSKKLIIELSNSYNTRMLSMKNITDKSCKKKLKNIFHENIFPTLTPINVENSSELPRLSNGQNAIIAIIEQNHSESVVIVPIPNHINKFISIKSDDNKNIIIPVEDIIIYFLSDLFINKKIIDVGVFNIIKDNSTLLNHDTNKFIVERMRQTLNTRNDSKPIFISITRRTSERLKNMISNIFGIKDKYIIHKYDIIDYKKFSHKILSDDYSYPKFKPNIFIAKNDSYNILESISKDDIILHHPFDSFDTVVKFIEHAAFDENVIAIKQTLYRVSSYDSPIVDALCEAAKRGKSVSVLIEIKARFDEERNISLIEKLESSGVMVTLGMEHLKTHCKMCLVVRNNPDTYKVDIFSHVGTGNYNEVTSQVYTDLSYFTSKRKIGVDLLHVFNILSGLSTPDEKLQKVFYAPVNLRKRLMKNIDREIAFAKQGKKAEIFIKLNSISDEGIINKLYEAANKGVKIDIICRGVCSIVPVKNITIKSVVGRFLEHSRLYYFSNNKNPEYYITSADLLTRNLDKRVEVLLLLNDKKSIRKIREIMNLYKNDNKNSYIMNEDGIYNKYELKNDKSFDVHQHLIDSLKPVNIISKKKK